MRLGLDDLQRKQRIGIDEPSTCQRSPVIGIALDEAYMDPASVNISMIETRCIA
jgi:hypothetical protein